MATPIGKPSPLPAVRRDDVSELVPRWEQAIQAVALGAYMMPFLWLAPFLASPPFWIAALTMAIEPPDRTGLRQLNGTARNPRAP